MGDVVNGLLAVDAERLFKLNQLPGITLATLAPGTVVGPDQKTAQAATLKIIPYAVPRSDWAQALALAGHEPGIVQVRALPQGRRAALLLVGELSAQEKVRTDFEAHNYL